jgi:predicted nucleic acid-binding protein
MIRLFLDSSVLFSAAYSSKGHSRDLLTLAIREEIVIVVSDLVIEETRRNLTEEAPESVTFLELVLNSLPLEFVKPSRNEITEAAKYVALKDAAIIAAAKKAKVDFLVTLDKKHLLGKTELDRYSRLKIVTPQDAVRQISAEE